MYTLTVGMEVHAELKTRTKMFCACLNNPDEKQPNKNICPVCMAHPGTLPVINKEAVRKVLLVGKAVGGNLADYTEFDRKNYFYPDIPKGYQISQYKHPLVQGGTLRGVLLTRIHLEEDTARSQHEGATSLVDYNRAGVPLMELVTEPVIHSAEEAGAFARELQLLLRTLGAGEANMEKGEMRVEANISVGKALLGGMLPGKLGTKVEVKNLNSFRSVERAVRFEFERQTKLLEAGKAVVQETRGWDEVTQQTYTMRLKEQAHDYRYFPDPDLPSLRISEVKELHDLVLPELPWERRSRYLALGLKAEDADMFVTQPQSGALFDTTITHFPTVDQRVMLSANYIANDLAGAAGAIQPKQLAELMTLLFENKLSSRGAKDALAEALKTKDDLLTIAQNYLQESDSSALEAVARQVVGEHAAAVAEYKAGKEAALQYLVGQGMRASKGKGNPQALKAALQKVLG